MLSSLIFGASTDTAQQSIKEAEFAAYCDRWQARRMPRPSERERVIRQLSSQVDALGVIYNAGPPGINIGTEAYEPTKVTLDLCELLNAVQDSLNYIERHT